MVKARKPQKPSKTKTSSVTPKWTKMAQKGKPVKKAAADSLPTCVECNDTIDNDAKALQCEFCSAEIWKCAHCLGLNDEFYDFLASSNDHGLHWFCDKCEEFVVEGIGSLSGKLLGLIQELSVKSDQIEQKISEITTTVEQKATDAVTNLEHTINDKVSTIESNVVHLIEEKMKKIEVSSPPENPTKQNLIDVGKVQECVVKALDVKNQEAKEEEMEIKRRETCVIVHGVTESDATSNDQREEDDIGVITAMMHELESDEVKVTKLIRLGKKAARTNEDMTVKPRPIKLVLESEEQKIQVLRRAKNLRLAKEGGWGAIFIHQDLTPKQREARKLLVQEMKERTIRGEKDLMIFNGKIIKKRSRAEDN